MYTGQTFSITDFGGGLNSNSPTTQLTNREASDLDNIVIRNGGRGFRQRYGDTTFNSVAMNSGTNVQGLGYFKTLDGNDWMVSVCGAKIFKSASLSGTMTDVSGSVTITAGANNIWTQLTFNNKHLGFGGPPTNPDAPWKYTGSGNAAALTGTPPSAYGAFQVNNRVFAFRTAADPSIIYWSVLGNESDWTSAGSGNADVYTSDNDSMCAAAVMNNNVVLLFKENSIHQMLISSAPFPIYPLFKGVGCAGKHAVVVADGLCYFINNQGRMRITDGSTIIDEKTIPALANTDDIWQGLVTSRYPYIQGVRRIGADFDHIIWSVTANSGTTNNYALVWDIKNKCWLKHSKGYKANVYTTHQNGNVYGGHYDGKIYLKDVSTASTDASETAANIIGYWTSGWMNEGSFETIKQPRKVSIVYKIGASGTFQFLYGYDFAGLTNTVQFNQSAISSLWDVATWDVSKWSSQSDYITSSRITDRGNVFQWQLINSSNNQWQINSVQFSGKQYGQKVISAG